MCEAKVKVSCESKANLKIWCEAIVIKVISESYAKVKPRCNATVKVMCRAKVKGLCEVEFEVMCEAQFLGTLSCKLRVCACY